MKAIVKSPLNHDGKPYQIGSLVELTEEQADSLAAIGVVEILSTIVEVEGEAASSGSPQENQGKTQEKKTKAAKEISNGTKSHE